MVSTYSDIALLTILVTIVLSFVIGRRITREDLKGIDGIFAVSGFIFGLFMTFMNLVYTSAGLFLLSPFIALSCVIYLRYRRRFKEKPHDSFLQISTRQNTILNITWWFLITAAVTIYYFSEIYTRHPLFFVLVSAAVAILGLQIITYYNIRDIKTFTFIINIFLISILLRYSAYYISPYPIGSDPWVHREYISYFLEYGRISVPSDFMYYYVNYPIAHLHAVVTALIGSLSIHDSMFVLSMILTFSTIATFLIVKMLTGDVQIALTSMLLLNFIDSQIQWSIQVIAMSFGIAIYVFIIYFVLNRYLNPNPGYGPKYASLLIIFLIIVVWIHTISAFITLVSLLALVLGVILYEIIYTKNLSITQSLNRSILVKPIIILSIVILYHWTDITYNFFGRVIPSLISSLSQEAKILEDTSVSNITGNWSELFQPIGFCIYVMFGIIGTLYCLTYKENVNKYFPIIVLTILLFVFRYAFPILGIRNIMPDRWPAFAFIVFAPLIVIGIFCSLNVLKEKRTILISMAILFFVGSFLMITNASTNHDSPLYGEGASLKLIWSESEMSLYAHINNVYDGTIITDLQTHGRPFKVYFKNERSKPYVLHPNGTIDTEFFSTGLVIWKEDSLKRPTTFQISQSRTLMLLDEQFCRFLEDDYSCIANIKTAKCYLPR